MPTELNQGVSYCIIGDVAVVLDLRQDKYLAVPAALFAADRASEALSAKGLLVGSGRYGASIRPFVYPRAESDLGYAKCRASLAARVAAVSAMARSTRGLRRQGMDRSVRNSTLQSSATHSVFSQEAYDRIRSAFDWADLLFERGKSCLTRSIAMRQMLHRRGLAANLVIGVQLYPFAAHAWLQRDDIVLNDSLDRIRNYHPIAAF